MISLVMQVALGKWIEIMQKINIMPAPSISRKPGALKPKVEIVIACEGRVTEPKYIRDCVSFYGAGLVKLRVVNQTGVPLTVVEAAVEERNRLLAKYRRSANSFDMVFRVWAVFDMDEHPKVDEAIALARENGIDVAFSNPCFELWPLLHLEDYGAQLGRHALQAKLKDIMPSYDHEKGALIDFELIKDNFGIAQRRASRLVQSREGEGVPLGRPSTTVGNLVEKIVQNGKTAFRRQR